MVHKSFIKINLGPISVGLKRSLSIFGISSWWPFWHDDTVILDIELIIEQQLLYVEGKAFSFENTRRAKNAFVKSEKSEYQTPEGVARIELWFGLRGFQW